MASSMSTSCSFKASMRISSLKSASLPISGKAFTSLNMSPKFRGFQISCAAKPETIEKVCSIVKKQLALTEDTTVTGESKFASLGADSLDTHCQVEIVMDLEEEFGISVEEESAQHIATVQDVADLIEELIEKNVS